MKTYLQCEALYAKRRKSNNWKKISHNQKLYYDAAHDCFQHQHHHTITVEVYRDKYVISTGGWDTPTTWKKIHEFSRCWIVTRPMFSFDPGKYVCWKNGQGDNCYTKFYDGIAVDLQGVPLKPKPVQVRKLRPQTLVITS